MPFSRVIVTLAVFLFCYQAQAADVQPATFANTAKPFLAAHCLACHGADVQEGKLAFHNLDPAKLGGDEAVVSSI